MRECGADRLPEEESGTTAQDHIVDVAAILHVAPQFGNGLLGNLLRCRKMRRQVVFFAEYPRLCAQA
jgi:hypothetical protein